MSRIRYDDLGDIWNQNTNILYSDDPEFDPTESFVCGSGVELQKAFLALFRVRKWRATINLKKEVGHTAPSDPPGGARVFTPESTSTLNFVVIHVSQIADEIHIPGTATWIKGTADFYERVNAVSVYIGLDLTEKAFRCLVSYSGNVPVTVYGLSLHFGFGMGTGKAKVTFLAKVWKGQESTQVIEDPNGTGSTRPATRLSLIDVEIDPSEYWGYDGFYDTGNGAILV